MAKTKLIVGLGNPGDKYAHSRHNAGFIILQNLIKGEWKEKKDWQSLVHEKVDGDQKTVFVLPQTFMNNSGQAVQAVKIFYKVENEDITVVHDELDLPFGEIRKKSGGGSAGHKGIESVAQYIGDDYYRIRIGIDNELAGLVEADRFVLSNFSKEEYEKLDELAKEVNEVLLA